MYHAVIYSRVSRENLQNLSKKTSDYSLNESKNYMNNQIQNYESSVIFKPIEVIKDIKFNVTERAYDFDTGSVEGYIEEDLIDPFIFEIQDQYEKVVYSGFITNWKWLDKIAKFTIKDLRTIFDSDIILDYSNGDNDFSLFRIYNKVTEQIQANAINMSYKFNIPQDTTNTAHIADYSNQYIIVNAYKFLKVYMTYYNYKIKGFYSKNNSTLNFNFQKQSQKNTDIKLEDFVHEKTKNDVKDNRVIATVKFQTIYEVDSEWVKATEIEYMAAATENKSTLMQNMLPPLRGYGKDHIIRLAKNSNFKQITLEEYDNTDVKTMYQIKLESGMATPGIWVSRRVLNTNGFKHQLIVNPRMQTPISPPKGQCLVLEEENTVYISVNLSLEAIGDLSTVGTGNILKTELIGCSCIGYVKYSCPIYAPTLYEAKSIININNYSYGTAIEVTFKDSNSRDCKIPIFIKLISLEIEYYKKGGTLVIPRPKTLPSKIYSLGTDNEIYDGEINEGLKVYPVQTKIFENETLGKAQLDAVYHLVNNRWNENITIHSKNSPIALRTLELLDKIRVYDKNNTFKDIPISEKTISFNGFIQESIKLGFKKELFTQIYKGDKSGSLMK